MQYGTTPISVEDLVKRFVCQLQAKAVLPADLIFETLADDAAHLDFPPADRFVLVRPTRFARIGPQWDGAGRYLQSYDGTFRVACVCRFAQDQEFRNTRELRDKTRSTLALGAKVIDALDGWAAPTDATAAYSYLTEPCQQRDFDIAPKRIEDGAWAVVSSTWSVKFVLSLQSGATGP